MKYLILAMLLMTACTKEPVAKKEIYYALGSCSRDGCTKIVANISEDECYSLIEGLVHLHRDVLKQKPVAVLACVQER